jgi:hypothetical protein
MHCEILMGLYSNSFSQVHIVLICHGFIHMVYYILDLMTYIHIPDIVYQWKAMIHYDP